MVMCSPAALPDAIFEVLETSNLEERQLRVKTSKEVLRWYPTRKFSF